MRTSMLRIIGLAILLPCAALAQVNGGVGSPIAVQNTDSTSIAGTDGTTAPPSGTGVRGWLAGVYAALTGTLKTQIQAGTAAIGSVVSSSPTVTYTAPFSSAITTGGTAQNAAAANTITHGCDLQNPATATEPLYYNLAGAAGTAASGTTFALAAGQPYHCPFPTTQALSVNAATTGHAFSLVVY